MKPILEVQHIGKSFFIGGQHERYLSLRDVITNSFKKFGQPTPKPFWALEDVSFNVMPGESIGIIGRNGAGKSTLLKILSKITPPTTGKIICRGRIASLLEVGTGFHPELTGRENIYMNGSILGMRKNEINKHFDAIVDFSGVEQFLDTPLKRYSSGMQLRLAFAVAAHLEPEILIIDEVLAVGDAEFQKKCLGKMGEVSKSGRTVLFVSHNMGAVMQLCQKGIVLQNGKVVSIDTAENAVKQYLFNVGSASQNAQSDLTNIPRKGNGNFLFQEINITDIKGNATNTFCIGDDVVISFIIKRNEMSIITSALTIQLKTFEEMPLAHIMNRDSNFVFKHDGVYEKFSITLNDVRFYPGDYSITLWSTSSAGTEIYDHIDAAATFTIADGGMLTTRSLPRAVGLLFLNPSWQKETVAQS